MPYQIVRNDITGMRVDAIVNPTDCVFSGSGGTDLQIHRAAGAGLRRACDALPCLEDGAVAVTDGFDLPCRYVIHTVGPVWKGGGHHEHESLFACYQNALAAADRYNCTSIAFPLIASGTFGYPKDRVMRIALDAIGGFLMTHDMTVYVVVFDKDSYSIGKKLQADIDSFIDENYVEQTTLSLSDRINAWDGARSFFPSVVFPALAPEPEAAEPNEEADQAPAQKESRARFCVASKPAAKQYGAAAGAEKLPAESLDAMLASLDEGFCGTLFRLIDRKGMTDVECYKKANIDKKLFSKIRNPAYHPSKATILAFAVALELTLDETKALLETAGLALSRSSRFDVIVEYFITNGIYDMTEINETLYRYDQPCLGNVIA